MKTAETFINLLKAAKDEKKSPRLIITLSGSFGDVRNYWVSSCGKWWGWFLILEASQILDCGLKAHEVKFIDSVS